MRRFVPDEVQAGSNPAVRSTVCPRSTKVVSQPRKPRVSVRFRPGARPYCSYRGCARSSADECRRDMPEIAGSIPAVRTMSCSSSRPGNRALNPVTRVRLPYTTPARKTPSSNGPGSESPNLRMAVRVRPESRRSYERIGCDPGSGWFPTPTSGVRLLGGLPARQAVHLVVRPVSYAGRAGFDPLACHDDPSGDSPGGCAAARVGTWRAGHLGVIAVLHTAGAGFDSLARYQRSVSTAAVPSPDKRKTKVRILHGTRSYTRSNQSSGPEILW